VKGPGTASITYSDSAATGYGQVTSNTVTVTAPALTFSAGSQTQLLGMRQHGGSTAYYVQVPNNVVDSLVVHLLSTGTRVATVPDSVIIPPGLYYAYFDITAQDTLGTIQIQATATGYTGGAMNVQVTQPKFTIGTSTQLNSTSGRTPITVYATDVNGTAHYVTEDVTVTLTSSSQSVAGIDSGTVTIVKDAYYNNHATWGPGGLVGTSKLTAQDLRSVFFKYADGFVDVTVVP
jgi:hypothetical protein